MVSGKKNKEIIEKSVTKVIFQNCLKFYCDQEPLWLLNVIEDHCYFLGVHMRTKGCKNQPKLKNEMFTLKEQIMVDRPDNN